MDFVLWDNIRTCPIGCLVAPSNWPEDKEVILQPLSVAFHPAGLELRYMWFERRSYDLPNGKRRFVWQRTL